MAQHYGIKPGDKILDIGCGKGFLMHDFTLAVPGVEVFGLDISEYAKTHSKEEISESITIGNASNLPWGDDSFDFVVSINTLHNLPNYDLDSALREIERVGKEKKYLCVESYRNEDEKANLLYWQLTCEAFCSPKEWEWWFEKTGYAGDHSFIYFE
jgi:protein-L-isoaspartate(D-aspartate) O-methyltransferase